MKYIVLPAEILAEVTQEALDYFHLSPRYSIDGSEVIMKVDNYEKTVSIGHDSTGNRRRISGSGLSISGV